MPVWIAVLSGASDFREWVCRCLLSSHENGLGESCRMWAEGSSVCLVLAMDVSSGRCGWEDSVLAWQVLIFPFALKWQTESLESFCLCLSCLQTVEIWQWDSGSVPTGPGNSREHLREAQPAPAARPHPPGLSDRRWCKQALSQEQPTRGKKKI